MSGDAEEQRKKVAELLEVLRLARRMSEASEGAFDVTVHPLCEVLASGELTEDRIAAARRLVDYRKLHIDAERIGFEQPGMRVTLNGVAQGYITDRITELLAREGYQTALVDIGEQRALGNHPENRPWRLGVRAPDGEGFAGVIDLAAGQALATSGGYGQIYAAVTSAGRKARGARAVDLLIASIAAHVDR